MELVLVYGAALVAFLAVQRIRGARYTGVQVVVGVAAGLGLVLAVTGAIALAGGAVGPSSVLWLSLVAAGVVALAAGFFLILRAVRRARFEETRSPFDLS